MSVVAIRLRPNERANTRRNLSLPPRESGLENAADYQIVTRDQNIRVSQRLLAALLKHHAANPPDLPSRYAVERIRQECFKPKTTRQVISTNCEELRRIETENALSAVEEMRKALERAAIRRRKILDSVEQDRALAKLYRKKSMAHIVAEVAKKYGITVHDILGRRRMYSVARQEAMWRCLKETENTSVRVGWHFNRDHSTVLYAADCFEARAASGENALVGSSAPFHGAE